MISLIISLILTVLLLAATVLLKTYKSVPLKELKRQARSGDDLASALYKVAAYGRSVDILLWFFIGIVTAALFTFLARHSSPFISVILIAIILWFGFLWLPRSHNTQFGRRLAKVMAPSLHWLIDFIYPILGRVETFINKRRPITLHTGLFTKDDLIDLFEQQREQLDNRISNDELLIARNALIFGEQQVSSVMTPRRVMKTVSSKDSISPVVMEELHKSGHSRFPVYGDSDDNFVGILFMKDMIKSKKGGLVKDLMNPNVYYVHDENNLSDVLQAFIKTHNHLFLVVNSFEEIVGLITMEDVIEQILGKPILDEFDEYDSLRSVAAKLARKEHDSQNEPIEALPK